MNDASRRTVTMSLPIASDVDLARVRQQVRQAAAERGFALVPLTKLLTAASELARNTLVHGGGGRVEIATVERGALRGLQLTFTDTGPGIRDLDRAMTDGCTSGGGLGLGLGGARRLVQEFAVESRPGHGTTVTVSAWVSGMPSPRPASE